MTTPLEVQANVIARALRSGLDPGAETHVEPLPVPKLDIVPGAVLYPGGRGQEFVVEAVDESGFEWRQTLWSVLLLGGLPHAAGAYLQLFTFVDNIDTALRQCATDPANTAGGAPIKTNVSAPFHIQLGGPEYLAVNADLEYVIPRE